MGNKINGARLSFVPSAEDSSCAHLICKRRKSAGACASSISPTSLCDFIIKSAKNNLPSTRNFSGRILGRKKSVGRLGSDATVGSKTVGKAVRDEK